MAVPSLRYPLIEVEVQPLYDGVTANLAIPACLAQLGRVVAQMGDGRLGIGAEQQGKARLICCLRGSRPARAG